MRKGAKEREGEGRKEGRRVRVSIYHLYWVRREKP